MALDPANEFWRFYLEYAPYGNLGNLASRYRAFNRYLPELFLWHVFNSLSKAVLELETYKDKNKCLYHLDIKPHNIFLGYEGTRSQDPAVTGGLDGETVGYPSVKLGDFGIAMLGKKRDRNLIKSIGVMGTRHYQAPVCKLNHTR